MGTDTSSCYGRSADGANSITSMTLNECRPADDGRAVLFLEEFFDAGDVFGDVNTYGVVFDFGDANFPAIFQPAELFELLDAFEFALRQSGIFEEGVALEDVEAEVFQVAHLDFGGGIADPGNRGARKIEAVVFEIEDDFYYVGVHDVRGRFDRGGYGGDSRGGLFEQGIDGSVDGYGIEKRLIALDIHEDVALFVKRDFRYALGSGAVVWSRHASLTAEGFHGFHDAFIVGGDNDAAGARGHLGAFIDVLDHGLASQREQAACRAVASSQSARE